MARIRTLTITDEERKELEQYRDHDARPYVRERCAAMLKIAEGKAPYWVALHGLLKVRRPDTVYEWLKLYEAGGVSALLTRQQGGDHRSGRFP